jgi:hypothetical protein
MTPDTQNALTGMETTLKTRYNTELDTAQTRALATETAISNLFSDMNKTLLEELQKSYTRAHVINSQRNQTMKTIDDLPLRVMA